MTQQVDFDTRLKIDNAASEAAEIRPSLTAAMAAVLEIAKDSGAAQFVKQAEEGQEQAEGLAKDADTVVEDCQLISAHYKRIEDAVSGL